MRLRSLCSMRFLLPTSTLLARHGHGGSERVRKNLERMILLEQAQDRPTGQPAAASLHAEASKRQAAPPPTGVAMGSFLGGIDDRVESARKSIFGADHTNGSLASSHGTRDIQVDTITSLSAFIGACKRMRADIGLEKRPKEREALRRKLREFWRQNADSAVSCCHMWGRDFGFVAGHGLSDDGLHLSLPALSAALATLQAEKAVSSAVDVMVSLHYISRELVYWEKLVSQQRQNVGSSPTQREKGGDLPSWESLIDLRHSITDIAVERIYFFFVRNASTGDMVTAGVSGYDEESGRDHLDGSSGNAMAEGRLIPSSTPHRAHGTSQDALSALEVLSRITVDDANQSLRKSLQHQQQTQGSQSSDGGDAKADVSTAVDQAFLVKQTFVVLVTEKRRFMNFTSLVQAFALLRIFLPLLWPPYNHGDRCGRGSPGPRAHNATDGETSRAPTPLASPTPPLRSSLSAEREVLQRITWGLAVSLRKHDSSFVNPYHFVKLTATLARLPSFTLAPYGSSARFTPSSPSFAGPMDGERHVSDKAASKREIRSLRELPMSNLFGNASTQAETSIFASAPLGQEHLHQGDKGRLSRSAADFWRYMVAKACIFVPSLPLQQRRAVVCGLHKAIHEKRGQLLASLAASKEAPVDELSDTADDILLPLVEEMATLEEGFDESLQRANGSARPHKSHNQRHQRQRRGDKKVAGSAFGRPPQGMKTHRSALGLEKNVQH